MADPTLADRLEEFGDKATTSYEVIQLGRIQPEPFRSQMMTVARDLYEGQRLARAAAVRLREADEDRRKLDAIRDAVGDVNAVRRWVDDHNGIKLRQLARRIADALGGTE